MKRRRRHSRVDAWIHVRVQHGDREFDGLCVNLAIGGMFVQTLEKAAFGDQLTVSLTLPSGHALSLPCTVRWVSSEGFGVQHGLLRAADTKALSDYLATLKAAAEDDDE
jgi:hypothetical protein